MIRVFDSFDDADRADAARDAALTPAQRIQIVLELQALRHPKCRFRKICASLSSY